LADKGLTAPARVSISQQKKGADRLVEVKWDTAFAGDAPLKAYEIRRDGKVISTVNHLPQITKTPFSFTDKVSDASSHEYAVVITDTAGRAAASETIRVTEI